jgi:hypothetical protein
VPVDDAGISSGRAEVGFRIAPSGFEESCGNRAVVDQMSLPPDWFEEHENFHEVEGWPEDEAPMCQRLALKSGCTPPAEAPDNPGEDETAGGHEGRAGRFR